MAKIVVECTDPNDLDAIERSVEDFAGRCNVTYFRQAQAMVDAGKATSLHDAADKIADATGETSKTVEHRIYRGQDAVPQVGENDATPTTPSQSDQNKQNKGLTQDGKPRQRAKGAGRKPKYQKDLMLAPTPTLADMKASDAFREAFEQFFSQIKIAKRERWQTTSKQAALAHIKVLYDVITIT